MQKTNYLILVDDDPDDQAIFMEALASVSPGTHCEVFQTGDEALDGLSKLMLLPDYIFLDLNLPRVNGKECLKEIRKNEMLKNTPVIIYTTSEAERDQQETRALGANYYFKKPVSFTHLTDGLETIFQYNFPAAV